MTHVLALLDALRIWVVSRLFPTRRCVSRFFCAGRSTGVYRTLNGHHEVTLTFRDLSYPDIYSREEVVRMLKLVRSEERRMNWTCPEPGGDRLPAARMTARVVQQRCGCASVGVERVAYCETHPE